MNCRANQMNHCQFPKVIPETCVYFLSLKVLCVIVKMVLLVVALIFLSEFIYSLRINSDYAAREATVKLFKFLKELAHSFWVEVEFCDFKMRYKNIVQSGFAI